MSLTFVDAAWMSPQIENIAVATRNMFLLKRDNGFSRRPVINEFNRMDAFLLAIMLKKD